MEVFKPPFDLFGCVTRLQAVILIDIPDELATKMEIHTRRPNQRTITEYSTSIVYLKPCYPTRRRAANDISVTERAFSLPRSPFVQCSAAYQPPNLSQISSQFLAESGHAFCYAQIPTAQMLCARRSLTSHETFGRVPNGDVFSRTYVPTPCIISMPLCRGASDKSATALSWWFHR
jgi:hypothetical protein